MKQMIKTVRRSWPVIFVFLGIIAFVDGCGSGYEIKESDGQVYVQRKSWWKRMFFGP